MNTLATIALAIAAKGQPVFPCTIDKKPITQNGFKAASTDAQVITDWWKQNPDANIGMPTGGISGVVVLDVDLDVTKSVDGEKSLAELVSRNGPLPETLTVRTPRGGRHIYFQHSGGKVPCSTAKLGVGLDVRGDGGYVLLPPSRTARGCYEYQHPMAVAPLPHWLLDLMMNGCVGPANPPVPTPSVLTSQEDERIRAALRYIPASLAHDEWVRIGMALHEWHPVRGKIIWTEWSKKCPEKFNERELETAWRSFKPGGGVTLGTLFELARNYGWRPKTPKVTTIVESSKSDLSEVTELSIPDWPAPPRPEAFHGVFGEYVKRLAPHTEADPMAILIQLVVGFGNLLGRTAHFVVEADTHYLNLNAVIVGNSSKARKGTSWGHVKRLLMLIDPTWPSPLTGLSTGEGLIHHVRDKAEKTKDGKQEVVDEGVHDKRLLAVESEFGRLLQCASREGNTLSAVIRQAFDTGDLRVATKSSPERATGAHISIIGHITSIELNLLLTKSDCANGLANRFIWPLVKRSKLLPEGGNAASLDFRDVVNKLSEAVEFGHQVGRLELDQQARELWRIIYAALSAEQPGLLGAVCSRAEAIVMRIATILAVTDWAEAITCAHLKAALAIWDYCAASAKFIFGNTLGNPIAEKVLTKLKLAGGSGVTLTGLYDHFNGHISKEELHAALKDLHSQGLARFESVKTSGRPVQVWFATLINGEESEKRLAPVAGVVPDSTTSTEGLSSHNSHDSQQGEWEVDL